MAEFHRKKKRICQMCAGKSVDYKDVMIVSKYINEKGKLLRTLKTIIVTIVVVVVFYNVGKYIDDKFSLNIFSRLFSLSEDGGSGRIDIYSNVWESFKSSSVMNKLFGHGVNAVGTIGAGAEKAHNDLLEVLYDYGIISFIFVTIFYISMVVEAVRLIKRKSPR